MKKRFYAFLMRNLPYAVAATGILCGILLLVCMGYDAFDEAPPLTSAFATPSPAMSLVADFSEEVKLFFPMAALSILVKHPFPAYVILFVRGLFFGFSSAYLFGTQGSPLLLFLYLAVHGAILVAYSAITFCVLPSLSARKEERLSSLAVFGYPFLFYSGVIFLLTVIRNLSYYLLL